MPGGERPLAAREVRRILRYRKLAAFHRITSRLEPSRRTRLLKAQLAVVGPLAAIRPGSSLAAPAAFVVLWELGRRQDAFALLERATPVAGPTALVRLARACFAIGEAARARPLVDRLPEGFERASMGAEFAFAEGRYADALAMAQTAVTGPGDHRGHFRIIERARAELEVLQPSWRPSLALTAAKSW